MHYFFIIVIWLLSMSTARADCWLQAEKMFNIESELLYAIAQQESAIKPGAIGYNRDGSTDIGLMQINSFHMKRLKKMGISETQLLHDPCISVIVGASILSDMMKIYGYSWEAVGAYNAGTSPKRADIRKSYAKKIWENYKKLKEMPAEEKNKRLSIALNK
ncbi:type III secretion system invasion protein IagB [Salmonella enterica]|uniref:Type III secretion system invasion protein IagB n=1 Tax=Salmonella enterica subsp. diarizonae serovar 48:i:z TaxID=1192842 RepID=A0A7U6BG91_SALDZ|nr:type III secretion system invasion protein IagB [Salmonella enterica]EAA4451964.1 type III secretion system invasion protein IagB [Salmonella enterica subsp. diarizonae]EDW6116866.1 type III secretion system invasion protein IagB [Salmonella enterica subsp. salamae]AXC73801.1 type III secretion system invasion protein IagB [Salmonella enterica subsp. diarizonae serovar 48:i:z]EAM2672294.1 type III secretion system invasion protein IagB [Salmonella enterica]EAM6404530.1 type III secretion sy